MRYRKLSDTGDYTFGQGSTEFLVNTPETVAQAVSTRLLLATGQWFLDTSEGTPYAEDILGTGTQETYDQAIQDRILGTPGVAAITAYSSYRSPERRLSVTATIGTIYGQAAVAVNF